ncbi:sigma-54-dependent transcriptional regulator [Fodinibius halophilus]|uniref:Sigma-54-dependent Fis family transcriptional regulator n=1 Tax=Fodinibius halophilus TaxID=1736908 RepID=A0A6M1STR2_9BACT|nr:sigma-54 dependent transcriptional regulator [Fodinibius halophilus]NGP87328.1 sigma-54-dependent Fis family transcriptional regulator [Fodinibius halophilus]
MNILETEKKSGQLLVVDDDEDVLQAAQLFLKQHVSNVDTEKNPHAIPNLIKNNHYDVVLLDMNFTEDVSSGQEGFKWLKKILQIDPSLAVVLITAYGDVEKAVKAIKRGASDFVLKPWKNEKLLATINAALNLTKSRRKVETLETQKKQLSADIDQHYQDIVGQSAVMQNVFETIEKVAKTDANVLITGENGTGKELVARALHRRSNRSEEVFINVDMGAISKNLFESELFGHQKGAFTDARESRAGRFEIASGGTLFLDEIGNLPLPLQPKLLSAIESRTVTRVGGNIPKEIDIRLICATNEPILELVQQQKFREDLLYRINTIQIQLPPLRDRTEDIPLLANHFLEKYAHKYEKEIHALSEPTLNKLGSYRWPGNVRELQHAVERAVIMTEHNILQPEDFLLTSQMDNGDHTLAFSNYNLEQVEKTVIQKALDKNGRNISKSADELGLSRASLYRRMEKYGL